MSNAVTAFMPRIQAYQYRRLLRAYNATATVHMQKPIARAAREGTGAAADADGAVQSTCFRLSAAVASLWAALLAAGFAAPCAASDGHWQPPGVHASAASLTDVLGRLDLARGSVGNSYAATLHVTGERRTLVVQMRAAGADVRFETAIDGAEYASGRAGGVRWRKNSAGLVRSIGSDLQGDPLDRWPVGILPVDAGDCELTGETGGKRPAWVVQDGGRAGIAHWLYIDKASGALVRETTREGSQVFTTTFDDLRQAAGALRPFHWQTTGFGGTADITVDSLAPAAGDGGVGAVPAGTPVAPLGPDSAAITLPATFERDQILISVLVNGRRSRFLLDTGTPEVLLDAGAAHRFGIDAVFGHGTIATLQAGRLRFEGQPIMTVPGIFGIDGILGYDFFAGSVVHIDYSRHAVDLLPRHDFVAPADTAPLRIQTNEGIPLVHGSIGPLNGERFALDTGSSDVLLPRYLWESRGRDAAVIGGTMLRDGPPFVQHFLEGPVATRLQSGIDFRLGDWNFPKSSAQVEVQAADATIDIPFDGIIGTNALDRFEWWFDYADGLAWIRPTR